MLEETDGTADTYEVRARRAIITWIAAGALVGGCSSLRDQASADPPATAPIDGVLRVGFVGEPSVDPATLNPTVPGDVVAADLLFDGLTRVDDEGDVAPELAASWATSDGVTWRFELADRRLPDGSRVTADHVARSLQRAIDAGAKSLAAARLAVISEVRAEGPSTVVVVVGGPYYELPALLADPSYGVVVGDAAPVLDPDLAATGPFRVDSTGDGVVRLEAIDAAATNVDSIELWWFDRHEEALAAFDRGEIHIAPLGESLKVPAGATETYVSAASLVLELDSRLGPWADATARVALSRSIDRVAAVGAATRDDPRVAWSLVPGVEGDCGERCEPSAEAVEALRAMEWSGGAIPLLVLPGTTSTAVAGRLIEQLGAIGIPTSASPADAAAIGAAVSDGSMRMTLFGVAGLAPTADPYLAAVFGSAGEENLSGYASDGFDAALAAARATADPVARRAAYGALERQALAGASVVPLMRPGERFAVSDRVEGVEAMGGVLFDERTVALAVSGRGN